MYFCVIEMQKIMILLFFFSWLYNFSLRDHQIRQITKRSFLLHFILSKVPTKVKCDFSWNFHRNPSNLWNQQIYRQQNCFENCSNHQVLIYHTKITLLYFILFFQVCCQETSKESVADKITWNDWNYDDFLEFVKN